MENDDDELVDDPEMGHHLDVCKECSDWLDLTIAMLERARFAGVNGTVRPEVSIAMSAARSDGCFCW